MRWRLSQKSGVMPRARPMRSAESAVTPRRPWTIWWTRTWGTADGLGEAVLGDAQLVQHLGQVFAGVDRLGGGHGVLLSGSR